MNVCLGKGYDGDFFRSVLKKQSKMLL